MKIKRLSCAMAGACLIMMSLAACSLGTIEAFDQNKIVLLQTEKMIDGEDIAVVETSQGSFTMRFFPSEAPKTVENFISLAQSGYFDGQMISRVEKVQEKNQVKGRLIAGNGKPVSEKGKSIYEKPIKAEISYNLCTIPGAVVAYAPNETVDSRFYIVGSRKVQQEELDEIVQNNYPKELVNMFQQYGGYPDEWLHQTVFAQVIDGMEVVDKIIAESSCTDKNEITDIQMISVTIEKYAEDSAGELAEESSEDVEQESPKADD